MRQSNPFGLSLSKPVLSLPKWPSLSLSKGSLRQTLRHGAFDKLSPLLGSNGAEVRR
jgi:hypothetical protein